MTNEPFQDDESFRDTVTHIDITGHRNWFYPKKPKGQFYQWRSVVSYFFVVVFFSLPFVKIHGDPLFLFNVIERKFIMFGVHFWPQDFFLFMLGMLIFILFVALFTVAYGRVFCGWVCPQTVFMEMVFRKIEYAIEGDGTHQRALNKSPWTAEKIRKKSLKLTLFFLIAVLVANTFLAYIIGIDELKKIVIEPLSLHIGGFTTMIIFSGAFFFIFSWFREQACLVVCPYGRMQSVLLDKHSIVVAYDHKRGEPRSKFNREIKTGVGDCIDCFECVRVCPTGIDIRHGTQLECTNCTACIDACNFMMEKVHKPKGLIRYASEYTIRTGKKLRWTPRMFAYTAVLLALVSLEAFLLITRSDVDVTINKVRGQIFTVQEDGQVNNLYQIKIINKTKDDMPIEMRVEGATVKPVGNAMMVKADSLEESEFFILMNANEITHRKNEMVIEFWTNGRLIQKEITTFIGPVAGAN
ncbi:MAG: cytochrome c oxidase accessory protein CcoG [Flavobacteriales bacterium]|nr:cytochrome c oxidase accessory protein CcoG [Flavobacteriales bacterium]